MTDQFPDNYPVYKRSTKMLVPVQPLIEGFQRSLREHGRRRAGLFRRLFLDHCRTGLERAAAIAPDSGCSA